MPPISTEERLQRATIELWERAPAEFVQFMTQLAAFADQQVVACVNSPTATLPNAQGRAQGILALQRLLAESRSATQTADRRRSNA
jgi:hypothetical protein